MFNPFWIITRTSLSTLSQTFIQVLRGIFTTLYDTHSQPISITHPHTYPSLSTLPPGAPRYLHHPGIGCGGRRGICVNLHAADGQDPVEWPLPHPPWPHLRFQVHPHHRFRIRASAHHMVHTHTIYPIDLPLPPWLIYPCSTASYPILSLSPLPFLILVLYPTSRCPPLLQDVVFLWSAHFGALGACGPLRHVHQHHRRWERDPPHSLTPYPSHPSITCSL